MRNTPWILSVAVLSLGLSAVAPARAKYNRAVNIITSNYDLVDTTYIDRGRLDGVKVGDKFEVKFRDGKLATQVMVTGVYERMASVKIVDSWLLKDGQLAKFDQRPMVVALQNKARRPAPDITVKAKSSAASAPKASASPAAPPEAAPSAPMQPEMPPAAPAGEPGAPAAPGAELSAPGMDGGLPAGPDAGGLPPDAGGLPSDAGMAAPDGGLPPMPDAGGMPPDAGGLPAMPDAGGAPMDAGGLPPMPDEGGMPPDAGGLPPAAPDGGMEIPPPPM